MKDTRSLATTCRDRRDLSDDEMSSVLRPVGRR
jgi:hypothetical protein